MKAILVAALLALLAGAAKADSVWTYTGNATSGPETAGIGEAVNPCACALTGTVLLDSNFNVLNYSFTEGNFTLNSSNSIGNFDLFLQGKWPDNPATLVPFFEWYISVNDGTHWIGTEYYGSTHEATDWGTGFYVQGNRGTWIDPVLAPEPGTLALVGLGLAGIVLKRRRKPAGSAVWYKLA